MEIRKLAVIPMNVMKYIFTFNGNKGNLYSAVKNLSCGVDVRPDDVNEKSWEWIKEKVYGTAENN